MKKKLAYVDHSFHKKTQSNDFLFELLKKDFIVDRYWDDSWNGSKSLDLSSLSNYDGIIFFQLLPSFSDLLKIDKPIFWVPMWDSVRTDYLFWFLVSRLNVQVICFTKVAQILCNRYKISSIFVQYYPRMNGVCKQNILKKNNSKVFIFCWYRGQISINNIINIAQQFDYEKLILIDNPDPGFEKLHLSTKMLENYKIEKIDREDFTHHTNYLDLMMQSDVFIAPRKKEGIGMSFLEALATNKLVVANNAPSMNEYISNNIDGILFDNNDFPTKKISLQHVRKMTSKANIRYQRGLKTWVRDRHKISKFISEKLIVKKFDFSITTKALLFSEYGIVKLARIIKHIYKIAFFTW